MSDLMLLPAEGFKFDADAVEKTLLELPGVSNLKRGHFFGSAIECEYTYCDRSTIVRLSDDGGFISTDSSGDDSLHFAIELQSRLKAPLQAIDDGYNFHIEDLRKVKTIDEFIKKMNEPPP